MDMIAKKQFRYNGRALEPGDRFQASDRAARIFRGTHKAEEAPSLPDQRAPEAAEVMPESPAPERRRRGGRYSRSDMRAQG